MDFFTFFTCEKTPQNNFSSQNFSVENNYFLFSKLALTFSFRIKWGCMVKKIQGNAKKKLNYVFMHHINYLYSPENKVKK